MGAADETIGSPEVAVAMPESVRVLLRDLGVDAVEIARRAGLADRALDGGQQLAVEQYFSLWDALEHELGPDAPVRFARTITADNFDPQLFAALCCRHLESAAAVVARWKRASGHAIDATLDVDDTLVISIDTPGWTSAPTGLVLTELLFWVALARLGTRSDVSPSCITTPTGSAGSVLDDYVGSVDWAVGAPSIAFSPCDARAPFLTANREMLSRLAPGLGTLDERMATWGDRTRLALVELLPTGRGSLDATAARLSVSPRTLHRRLSEEGTSYRRVLDATRRELAELYLEQPTTTSHEASMLLGYQNPRSFRRAIRDWRRDDRALAEGSHP